MKDFKDRLAYLMNLNNISNYRLAKETGLSASTIANWLNGSTTPDNTKLDAVGLLLGCDVNWLATGVGDTPEKKEDAVADRLKMVMLDLGYQIPSFSKEIGASNALLQAMFERKGHVSSSVLVNLSKAFPQINIDWLITGKGEMIKEKEDSLKKKTQLTYQQENSENIKITSIEFESIRKDNEFLKQEISHLNDNLKMKDVLIASLRETIEILKNRQ